MEVESQRFMQFHACRTCAFKVYQDLSKRATLQCAASIFPPICLTLFNSLTHFVEGLHARSAAGNREV